ncbi:conserved hypothetical protein [Neospora caninum Liverpool]|uniref:Uncharacterized protein n=1 Tax=Neospora caninum (strain Liverpool) TaxID=572307 RepID=F0VQF8_NEOCL|nr:conserved hypothetical protein [Neospora caninum Liverpool]CBZ55955.1 conserved hypothetical protein [Neospora caninum Liverpool]|eukprot:XP_003885981.1 conserved hypothetical protein [Neospora caninum Liverpool]
MEPPQRAGDPSSSCGGPEQTDVAESSTSATSGLLAGPSDVFSAPARTLFSEGPRGGSQGAPDSVAPSPFAYQQGSETVANAPGLDAGRTAIASDASALLHTSSSGHRYHEGIKSARPTASSLQQASRHSNLLRVRRSDRDKAVASRRRQFMPLEAPPLPQPLSPIVQQLQGLLPIPPFATGGEGARPLPVHEEVLRLMKLLHELMACFPGLVEENPSALPSGPPHLAPRLDPGNEPRSCMGPVLMASLVQPIREIVAVAVEAATFSLDRRGEMCSPLVLEFALRLLQHACGCIAATVAAQPLPDVAVQCWLPLLFSVFRRLRGAIEAAGPPERLPGSVHPLVPRLRQIQHEVVYALGNIAADLEGGVLEQGGVVVALETMQDALLQLDSQASALEPASCGSTASATPGDSPALHLRTGGWLLGNLLQLPRSTPAILDDMLGRRQLATHGDAGEGATAGLRLGGLQVLHALLRLEVEHQHAALRLPANDDRRAAVAEGLWSLLLFLEAVLRGPVVPAVDPHHRSKAAMQRTLDHSGAGAAAAAAEEETAKTLELVAPEIVSLLIRLVFEAFQGAETWRTRRRAAAMQGTNQALFSGGIDSTFAFGAKGGSMDSPAAERAQAGTVPRFGAGGPLDVTTSELVGDRGDGVTDRLARFNENGADILIPALKILAPCTFLALKPEPFVAEPAVEQTDYVVPLIRGLAEILHSAEPVDIRREAAVSLLHVGLNHGKKHLSEVVHAEPSVIQGMLDILEQNKYDRACVITALDFLNGVLESQPTGRVEVYRRDGIAKIESAQFLHDQAIDNFISWMVSHYFDDFNEAEGDDEAIERIVAEEDALAAQLSDLSKGT